MAYVGQMLMHLPLLTQSIRVPPPRELLEAPRRTILRCAQQEYQALGRTAGLQWLSLVFAGVDVADGAFAWWCLSLDPEHPTASAPVVSRLQPREDRHRHGADLRRVRREIWDDSEHAWLELQGAPPLLRREDLH